MQKLTKQTSKLLNMKKNEKYIKRVIIDFFVCRLYTILNVLEFNSARKRMSVIVKDEEGKILLLCKGADRLVKLQLNKRHTFLKFLN